MIDNEITSCRITYRYYRNRHNANTSQNAPLIVRTPSFKGQLKTEGLVEFIDIYPSLCELAGLSLTDQLRGKSFVLLLDDPGLFWKNEVYARFHEGESIITKQYLLYRMV